MYVSVRTTWSLALVSSSMMVWMMSEGTSRNVATVSFEGIHMEVKLLTLLSLLFLMVVNVVGSCGDGQKEFGLASCHLGPASCFHNLFESIQYARRDVFFFEVKESVSNGALAVGRFVCSEDFLAVSFIILRHRRLNLHKSRTADLDFLT